MISVGSLEDIGSLDVSAIAVGAVEVRTVSVGDVVVWTAGSPVGLVSVDDTTVGTGLLQWEYKGAVGAWQTSKTEHYSSITGASATLRFHGTSAELRGAKDAHHGILSVSLDGAAAVNIDAYAATRQDDAALYSSGTLTNKLHTLTVTVAGTKSASSGGTVVAINRAVVAATTAPGVNVWVDDSSTGVGELQWDFGGTWQTTAGDRYTASTNATATLRFTGTSVKIQGTRDAHHGQMSVSVDGGAAVTVDCYSAVRVLNDTLFTASLTDGAHTVVCTVTGVKHASSAGFVVAVDGASVVSTGLTQPPPPPVVAPAIVIDEPWNGTYNVTTSSRPFVLESAGSASVGGGVLKHNAYPDIYSRIYWTTRRVGGPGVPLIVRYRVRATIIRSFSSGDSGTIPSAAFWYRCPKDGVDQDNWRNVISDGDPNTTGPSSTIFRVGVGALGRVEVMPFNGGVNPGKYVTGEYTRLNLGYTTGTWFDITLRYDWIKTDEWRYRLWRVAGGGANDPVGAHSMSGTPTFDKQIYVPYQNKAGFLAFRTDFLNAEYAYFQVEEVGVKSTATVPATSSLTVTGTTTPALSWTVSSNGGSAITGHTIQRRTGTGAWATLATLAASATSYSDTTAAAATQYGYRHAATNAVGTAGWSAEKTITTSGTSGTSLSYLAPADTFTGSLAAWRTVNGTVTVNGSGQAVLDYATSGALLGTLADATGKAASLQYVSHTVASGTTSSLAIRVNSSNYAGLVLVNGNGVMTFREVAAGVTSDTTATFSATSMKFWRIRHDSATDEWVWETSGDGSSWTERRRKARGFAITSSAYARVEAFRFSGTNTGSFVCDNVNVSVAPQEALSSFTDTYDGATVARYIAHELNDTASVPYYAEYPESGHDTYAARENGLLRKLNTDRFHRHWMKTRFGGPGKHLVLKTRVRCLTFTEDTATTIVESIRFFFRFTSPNQTDQGPGGVRSTHTFGAPGGYYLMPQSMTGYTEISRSDFDDAGYVFLQNKNRPYTTGTWQDIESHIEWLPNGTDIRLRVVIDGSTWLDYTDVNSPFAGKDCFPGVRSDFATWEIDTWTLEYVGVVAPALTVAYEV